jgi:hypothetical protein
MEENLPESLSVRHISHMNWYGMDLRPPLGESGDQLSKRNSSKRLLTNTVITSQEAHRVSGNLLKLFGKIISDYS